MLLSRLRRASLALLLGFAASGAQAECLGPSLLDRLDDRKRADLAAAVAATPFGEGLLWSARRDGARLLIAGTMHMPDPRHAPILEALRPAIRDADLVLLEATPAEEEAMTAALAASPSLAVLDGPALSERLPPEAWTLVATAAEDRGLAPETAARFRPWLLMMALSAPPCARGGLDPEAAGLDHLIMRAAQAGGTPLAALEPWDTLFRLFDDEGEARQVEMLELSLLEPSASEGMLVAMREGYFAGRTAELREIPRLGTHFLPPALAGADRAALGSLEAALLTRRNAAWVPVIEEAARHSPRLVVAAGAAHLPGEEGLLLLLEGSGWVIEPVGIGECCEGFWRAGERLAAAGRPS